MQADFLPDNFEEIIISLLIRHNQAKQIKCECNHEDSCPHLKFWADLFLTLEKLNRFINDEYKLKANNEEKF